MPIGLAIILTSFAAAILAQTLLLTSAEVWSKRSMRTDDILRSAINAVFTFAAIAAFVGAIIWIWSEA